MNKLIVLGVELDDALEMVKFIGESVNTIRANNNVVTVEDEVRISILERFNSDLKLAIVKQASSDEIDEVIDENQQFFKQR